MVGDIGQKLKIVYHSHLIENTGFLEDLLCQTKGLSALQGGQIGGVVYALTEIQLLMRLSKNPKHGELMIVTY